MKGVRSLFQRELKEWIKSPLLYLLSAFFIVFGSIFLIQFLLNFSKELPQLPAEQQSNILFASSVFIPFLSNLNLALLFIFPLVSIISLNKEIKNRLYYHWILAKKSFVSALSSKFFALSFILLLFMTLSASYCYAYFMVGAHFHWSILLAFFSLFLQGVFYISVSLLSASLFFHIPLALFFSFLLIMLNWAIRPIVLNFSNIYFQETLSYLSFSFHLEELGRGLLSSQAIIFYLSSVALCLYLSAYTLSWRLKIKTFNWKEMLKVGLLSFSLFALVNTLAHQTTFEVDLSQAKQNTISDKLKNILRGIKEKNTLRVFASQKDWGQYKPILNLLKKESNQIEVHYHDLNFDLPLAESLGVMQPGTLVIQRGDKKKLIPFKSELVIANGLMEVNQEKATVVGFLQGHGEFAINNKKDLGLSYLHQILLDEGIKSVEVNLSKDTKLQGIDILCIAQPKEDFTKGELFLIEKFTNQGGSLFLLHGADFKKRKMPSFETWLIQNFGVKFDENVVLDRLSSLQGVEAIMPIATNFNQNHAISKGVNFRVVTPFARSLTYNSSFAQELMSSAPFPASWGETSFEQLKSGKVVFEEQVDSKGPMTLGIAGNKVKGKYVFLGSSQMVANRFSRFDGNFNFFLNSLEWLAGNEYLISLDRPQIKGQKVFITSSQIKFLSWLYLFILPFSLLLIAILLFWRRRQW